MNFWNDRELAVRLKKHQVDSSEQFGYVLLPILVSLIILLIINYSTNIESLVSSIYYCYITLGTIIVYRTNMKGDNKDFISRYISLGIPNTLRSLIVGLIASAIVSLIFMKIENNDDYLNTANIFKARIIFSNAFCIYFFKRLNASMKIASGQL
jgi:hypothetical protein